MPKIVTIEPLSANFWWPNHPIYNPDTDDDFSISFRERGKKISFVLVIGLARFDINWFLPSPEGADELRFWLDQVGVESENEISKLDSVTFRYIPDVDVSVGRDKWLKAIHKMRRNPAPETEVEVLVPGETFTKKTVERGLRAYMEHFWKLKNIIIRWYRGKYSIEKSRQDFIDWLTYDIGGFKALSLSQAKEIATKLFSEEKEKWT